MNCGHRSIDGSGGGERKRSEVVDVFEGRTAVRWSHSSLLLGVCIRGEWCWGEKYEGMDEASSRARNGAEQAGLPGHGL